MISSVDATEAPMVPFTKLGHVFIHDPDGNMVEFIGPTRRTGASTR